MQPIPLRAQIAELRRELVMRARVYPGMVLKSTLAPDEAHRRIKAMEAALATLEHVAEERFKAEAAAARSSRR